MSVTATKSRNIVRVSFMVPWNPDEGRFHEAEIVTFIRLISGKLEINYSHHILRSRSSPMGPHMDQIIHRMPYTSSVRAVVESGAMHEFWSHFAPVSRIMPGEIGKPDGLEAGN